MKKRRNRQPYFAFPALNIAATRVTRAGPLVQDLRRAWPGRSWRAADVIKAKCGRPFQKQQPWEGRGSRRRCRAAAPLPQDLRILLPLFSRHFSPIVLQSGGPACARARESLPSPRTKASARAWGLGPQAARLQGDQLCFSPSTLGAYTTRTRSTGTFVADCTVKPSAMCIAPMGAVI